MARARDRVRVARRNLEEGSPDVAASLAYYAMLYAARAALSERDQESRTHRGTWDLFHRSFVSGGSFDPELHRLAASAQRVREASDYLAGEVSTAEAEELLDAAQRFVAAVEEMFSG